MDEIRRWYDGYAFSKALMRVYNRFSLLLLFDTQDFPNFWFETGTPTFLRVDELSFSSYEVEDLRPVPLLLQAGCLTIKDYDPESPMFRVFYPNFEVESAFLKYLLDGFSSAEIGRIGPQTGLGNAECGGRSPELKGHLPCGRHSLSME
jgi:hypothetical protein